MKFKFKIQQYQTDAVNAIIGVFKGQPRLDKVKYTRDLGIKNPDAQQTLFDLPGYEKDDMGFENAKIVLSDEMLLKNINGIQSDIGNYSPDWAIAFKEGAVKHVYFIAETKGTLSSLELRPIEQAKIRCARKLFNEISTSEVKYHDVTSYQELLDVMGSL